MTHHSIRRTTNGITPNNGVRSHKMLWIVHHTAPNPTPSISIAMVFCRLRNGQVPKRHIAIECVRRLSRDSSPNLDKVCHLSPPDTLKGVAV
jgi:hypothetical protein